MNTPKPFQKNLLFLRKKHGISQVELALQLQKAQSSISSWEADGIEPSYEDLVRIIRIFDISVDDFIQRDLTEVHPTNKKENKKNVHATVHPSVHATKKYEQNDAVSMANENAPPVEDYKEKYLKLLETVINSNKFITVGVFQEILAASNARHAAFQEYVLLALSALDKKGSYEQRAAEVHKLMLQKLQTMGTSSAENI